LQSKHCINERRISIEIENTRTSKKNKISQEELAIAVGVTRQTITSLECEKYVASLSLAYKIAKYFNLPLN
jgi:DNA-binding XRE family transcriptional regulator